MEMTRRRLDVRSDRCGGVVEPMAAAARAMRRAASVVGRRQGRRRGGAEPMRRGDEVDHDRSEAERGGRGEAVARYDNGERLSRWKRSGSDYPAT
ncbi:hypothetical protein ZWY2020_040344 [Hordeum vulgare]|nr:hypothetical protein ZWY2020_040344 [Hordeum vulgare]